jgi:hypothetical protein
MSAGTILVMSGDEILMDYHSCLGPIDPQVERDGRLIPALSYLSQYEDLIEKSQSGGLSTAELVLLQKLDLAELHQFELARDLWIRDKTSAVHLIPFRGSAGWCSSSRRGIDGARY